MISSKYFTVMREEQRKCKNQLNINENLVWNRKVFLAQIDLKLKHKVNGHSLWPHAVHTC